MAQIGVGKTTCIKDISDILGQMDYNEWNLVWNS